MFAHRNKTVVEQGHFICITRVRVGRGFGKRGERQGNAGVVGGYTLGSLDESIHDVADVDV
jgi:hypothetical protein